MRTLFPSPFCLEEMKMAKEKEDRKVKVAARPTERRARRPYTTRLSRREADDDAGDDDDH